MAEPEPTGTKLALITAAGELFAEHGLEGTSVRAIAEKAGTNVAAINYHFGSKENLHAEVMRYVMLDADLRRPSTLLQDEERFNTPEGIAQVIAELIHGRFETYFSQDQPSWYSRLIVRAFLDRTPSLNVVVQQVFRPDQEAVMHILRRANPTLSEEEACFWAFSLNAEIAFFEFCKTPILLLLEKESYDQSFLKAAAGHVARMITAALGLPEPVE
ncbi:MAG TPA: CerR family C-terminal domain-containing protein [Candidatus Hydrogenedentes bacterium]|nr:CerR family C-terminal domain-containing protein [Candidatus Hydrogenedentota bacterium]HPG66706.1 CerR family C-terminal domain-containing protein [Candidatus Hydrogenedentota bacterium]